ncbi:MAG TPA: hypothetical protein VGX03_32700, partial [Candidatus Binatia bacterium]|nr:hypothetical protein [Candidatus Binatia bacterium]
MTERVAGSVIPAKAGIQVFALDEGHRAVVAGAVPHMIAGRKNDADVLLRKRNRVLDREDYKMTVSSPLWITETEVVSLL